MIVRSAQCRFSLTVVHRRWGYRLQWHGQRVEKTSAITAVAPGWRCHPKKALF
ncbi:MAG: hypothetical protein ACUVQR_04245 [Thermogutta sp.]